MLILSLWVHVHGTTETSPKGLPTIYIDSLGINITGNAKDDQKAIEKTLRGYQNRLLDYLIKTYRIIISYYYHLKKLIVYSNPPDNIF